MCQELTLKEEFRKGQSSKKKDKFTGKWRNRKDKLVLEQKKLQEKRLNNLKSSKR